MRDLPAPTQAFGDLAGFSLPNQWFKSALPPLQPLQPLQPRQPHGTLRELPAVPTAQPAAAPAPALTVSWAQNEDEVREAQALRFEVFVVEMGAKLTSPRWGFDIDHFDEFCEHLLVRDAHTQRVVGTYRVLTPAQAKRAGGLYTETEFDLSRLDLPRERVLELGRSCVQAQYRNGAAILALWGALAEFMGRNQLDIMIGCASIPLGHMYSVDARWALQRAAALFASIDAEHLLPTPLPAVPRNGLGLDGTSAKAQKTGGAELPALIKAYLRLGARVMGPPAWDTSFNCADLPLILNAHDLRGRHKRAFEQARIQG